jgi:hypothetical protein
VGGSAENGLSIHGRSFRSPRQACSGTPPNSSPVDTGGTNETSEWPGAPYSEHLAGGDGNAMFAARATWGSMGSSRDRHYKSDLELAEGQEPDFRAAGLREFRSCSSSKMRSLFSRASSSGERAKLTAIRRA